MANAASPRGSKQLPRFSHMRFILTLACLCILTWGCTGKLHQENGLAQGATSESCPQGTLVCDGKCVQPLTDDAHCGSCGNACPAGSFCVEGSCELSCPIGAQECEGACTTVVNDPGNCGGCGTSCAGGEFCDAGSCSAECSGVLCPGESGTLCVHAESDPDHCGSCGAACPEGESCIDGACELVCPEGRTACSGLCADTSSSTEHCGACGNACDGSTPCIAGQCGCAAEETLCSGQCVDTQANAEHCGSCDSPCQQDRFCNLGACTADCGTLTACDGACVDLASNSQNCGGCGEACATGQDCVEGTCECPEGQELCGGACVETSSDDSHCGSCDAACPSATSCVDAECRCPEGQSLCGDLCVDLTSDDAHCGQCGNQCSSAQFCEGSECSCPDGLTRCGDLCVDTQTSDEHCGSCGEVCDEGQSCQEGFCRGAAGADGCSGLARNVSLDSLVIYQAVESTLMEDGSAVAVDSRTVPVVQGRAAMLRAFVDVDDDWVSREVSVRLHLTTGGEEFTFFHKKDLTDESTNGDLSSTFNIDIDPDLIGADTSYAAEIVECTTPPAGTSSEARFPVEGQQDLLARETGPVRIVFLPLIHDGWEPDTSESALAEYIDDFEGVVGTTGIEHSVADAIPSGQSGTSVDWSALLETVRNARDAANPADDVYYYGLFRGAETFRDFCSGGCTAGVGYVVDDEGDGTQSWNAGFRAAVGVAWGSGATFTHELGHNHGRPHSPCGGASSPDPEYPYSNGSIGTWGYDLRAGALRTPSDTTDFMAYCNPSWVSDYTYRKMARRIAVLNGVADPPQAYISGEPAEEARWHVLYVTPSRLWWGNPYPEPKLPSGKPTEGVVYGEDGDPIADITVYVTELSAHDQSVMLVPPPHDGWYAVGAKGGPALPY